MSEHSPFLVMCEMWGAERALEKCKEFNIAVSKSDLLKARDREAQIRGKPPEEVTQDA